METELEAIKEAEESGDFTTARALADAYVAANPSVYTGYDDDLPRCVKRVETFRAAELEDNQWQAEAWVLHRFSPQNIGGNATVQIRVPDNG